LLEFSQSKTIKGKEGDMSKRLMLTIFALAFCLGLTACSTTKAPAETAIKAADDALAGVRSEASVYVPDQFREVESSLADARKNFQNGDYPQALEVATGLAGKARDLRVAVAARKDELSQTWQSMSSDLPGMMKSIQSRVNVLSRSGRLPAGMNRSRFESIKASLASHQKTLSEASNSFKSGNLMDAVNKAQSVRERAVEIMTALKMKIPE
jgi:hypothetical protein